mmetsp:Transcript_9403/g.35206  ORF Transcript_9403/g.35206 Transcript_9403/m.35206 type:complete len:228 (+) Transcript_9403:918-1601(+)
MTCSRSLLRTALNSSFTFEMASRTAMTWGFFTGAFSAASATRSSTSAAEVSSSRSFLGSRGGSKPSLPQTRSAASSTAFTASSESSQGRSDFSSSSTFRNGICCSSFGSAESARRARTSRTYKRAICPAFPPRMMSVPRPAMLVLTVTAPRRPACATMAASRLAASGLALRIATSSTPCSSSASTSISDDSTLVVPTSTGLPESFMLAMSLATALNLPGTVLYTTVG